MFKAACFGFVFTCGGGCLKPLGGIPVSCFGLYTIPQTGRMPLVHFLVVSNSLRKELVVRHHVVWRFLLDQQVVVSHGSHPFFFQFVPLEFPFLFVHGSQGLPIL